MASNTHEYKSIGINNHQQSQLRIASFAVS